MSYSYINRDYLKNKPQFWLCLPYPRRTTVRKLTDIYNVDVKMNLGKVWELSFDMPVKIERDHQLIKNPLIDQFNGFYQVRMEWNGITEYFVYTMGNRKVDNSGTVLSYRLYSSAYLISKKMIRAYEETSKNLTYHAELFLEQTNWKVGFVDADFDLMYREITQSEATALQCIYDLATTFNAMIKFDTVKQEVNFYKPENVGINKGMTFKTGIFIESLGYEINFDEIVTRLSVFGADGLEFRRLTPTGANYIEDLSWFMYPFECDENYNVIKSSKWMTDSLCIAYTKYQEKLTQIGGTFDTLTSNKTEKDDEVIQLESELATLQTEMNTIENDLWVINKTYKDEAPNREDWQELVARKEAQQVKLDAKKAEIEAVKNEINDILTQLTNLRLDVQVENNFTADEIIEMNEFIHHKTYTNSSIVDDEDLFKDGLEAFKKLNQPPITISFDLVNFLNDIEFEKIYNRISLGDTIKVKSEEINVYIALKIIEISYSQTSDKISLTISNEEDLKDDMAKLVDKIYTSASTSTQVNIDKYKWNLGETANDAVTRILNSEWDTAKNAIVGGHENTTIVDKYGLKSVNSEDKNNFLFINNGILGVTSDGLNSIGVAIDKDGVHADKIVGKIIMSNKMWIEDELGVVEVKSGLQTIYDADGNPRVYLGRYPKADDSTQFEYGLRVIDGAFDIRTSDDTNKGIVINGDGIKAYNNNGAQTFEVDASTGHVSIIGDMTIKSHGDDQKGVVIDGDGIKTYNNSGYETFEVDAQTGKVSIISDLCIKTHAEDKTGVLIDSNGIIVYDAEGNEAFVANNNGNVTFSGALSNASGTVDELGGSFVGIFGGTLTAETVQSININASQVTTGTLNANRIGADSITASKIASGAIETEHLTAGIINSTHIQTEGLDASTIKTGTLSAITIDGVTIIGENANIEGTLTVGNQLNLGDMESDDLKMIKFKNSATIYSPEYEESNLYVSAENFYVIGGNLILGAQQGYTTWLQGAIDFSDVTTINWGTHKPQAVFG